VNLNIRISDFTLGARPSLNSLKPFQGPLIADVAGIQGGSRLKEKDLSFFVGHGTMLHAMRNDQELSFFNPDLPIPELHAEATLHNHEKLVLMVVMMPNEGPLKLNELDLLAVQLADDFRTPVSIETSEFVSEIDLFHRYVARASAPRSRTGHYRTIPEGESHPAINLAPNEREIRSFIPKERRRAT
jgi:hypothetical protein